MADSKITALTAETAPVDADLLAMVDDVAGTPVTKKVTFANAAASAPFTSRYAPKPYFDEFQRTAGDITVDTAGSWATLTSEAGGGTTDFDLQVAASAGDVLLISVHALWGTYSHASEFRTGRIDFASIVSASPVNYLGARAGSTILGGMPGFVGGLVQLAGATVESDVIAPTAGTGGLYPYPVQAGDISGGTVTLRPYVRVESSGRTLFASASNPLTYFVLNVRGLAAS